MQPPLSPSSSLLTLTMDKDSNHKSNHTSAPTEKQKAAGELRFLPISSSEWHCTPGLDIDYTTDEGSKEQLKKKMKALKDKIEKLSGTNMALTDSLRAMQKESAHACDNRGEKDSSEGDSDKDDPPMLFTAWNVCISGHLSPDAIN